MRNILQPPSANSQCPHARQAQLALHAGAERVEAGNQPDARERVANALQTRAAGEHDHLEVRLLSDEDTQPIGHGLRIAQTFLDGIDEPGRLAEHQTRRAQAVAQLSHLLAAAGFAGLGALVAAEDDDQAVTALRERRRAAPRSSC